MDGQRAKADHKSSPCHFVTGELKNQSFETVLCCCYSRLCSQKKFSVSAPLIKSGMGSLKVCQNRTYPYCQNSHACSGM